MLLNQTVPDQTAPAAPEAGAAPRALVRYGPALIAAALYALITLVLLFASYRAAEHHFIYPLDDTYIGMAIAKNLALHGVWGVSRYSFSSSDSSVLFPLLLAGTDRLVGVNQYEPLVLSWLFGLASIFVAARMLAGFLDRKGQTVILFLLVLLTPLFALAVLGMEHSLHLLLTLLFLQYFLEPASVPPRPERLWQIGAITTLMVATRYEGLFFVLPACCILLLQRRWKPALVIALAAGIPVCAYAGYSIAHGGYWLPNSVALKGIQVDHASMFSAVSDALGVVAQNYRDGGIQLILLLAGIALAAISLHKSSRHAVPLVLVLVAGCLHLGAARIGVLYRYEGYLVGAGLVAMACAFPTLMRIGYRPTFLLAWFLFLASGGILLMSSIASAHLLPMCSRNIYAQQWQMARFVHSYFPQETVAANDIGAIDYFSDIHCYDLIGLANADIFLARRSGRYTTEFLRTDVAAHHVQIAMLYDSWFATPAPGLMGGPQLPAGWVRIARWDMQTGAVMGDRTVSFYAVDPSQAPALRKALLQFDPTLPDNVIVLPQ